MADRVDKIPGSWWGKTALAGVVGAVVMGLYEMIAAAAGSTVVGAFWLPLNMIGATFPAFFPPSPGFIAGPTLTGLTIHLLMGAAWGLVYGAVAAAAFPRALHNWAGSTLAGLGLGLSAYVITGLILGPLVNPALTAANPWNYFIGHMIFGFVTAWSLTAMTSRREVEITYVPSRAPVAERDKLHR